MPWGHPPGHLASAAPGPRPSRRCYGAVCSPDLRNALRAHLGIGPGARAATPFRTVSTSRCGAALPAGETDARSLTPGPLTSVAAEFAAAETVATCDVLPRLVPTTYSDSALDAWPRRLAGDNFDREFRLRDNAQSSLWQAGRNLA